MEGLATVKQSIQDMLQLVITNAEREEQEKPLLHVNLNRIFLGNPGTGKTTVAKLYARILGHLGMLSKGEVILRTASDFVGGALGKSEEITRGILEQSKGCVLVIDEAYGLYQSVGNNAKGSNEPFRDAVINTLVEQIQGLPGEDRAVIMLGYRKQMEEMLTNVNPGLSRRFQLENAFEFDDYDDDALGRILIRSVKDGGLKIKPMVALFAIEQLSKAKARPHFGNAGAVNNLLSNAKLRMQKRMFARSSGLKGRSSGSVDDPIDVDELMKEDFVPEDWTDEKVSPEALLNEFVGNDEIKSKLQKYCNLVEYNLKKGKDRNNNVPYTYLFLGAPGTGKTTIARMMGKMFQSLQLIPFDEVIEVSASDFMTGYAGQSGMKTRIMFEKAKGKVLFIDEAYQLNPAKGGQFMAEVVDEIVKLMTSEEYQKKIMIILAGYEHDMNEMLRINKGLLSRFQERVHFHPLTTKQIEILIFKKLSDNDEGKVAEDACAVLCSIAGRLKDLPNFSNGRDVETFVAKVINEKVHRLHENDSDIILLSDVESALMEMKNMKPACDLAFLPFPFTAVPCSNVASAMEAPPPPTVYEIATDYEADVGPAQMEAEEEEEEEEVNFEMIKEDGGEEEQTKSTDWGPAQFLTSLQSILDEAGWNNEEKIRLLSGYPLDHPEVMRVRAKLAASTTYSAKTIEELVSSWQRNQGTVQAIQAETEKAKGTKALVPIWRCGVCGRADQPYIACYVAPFVVRYEERLLN